jgi:hypothetical protein
MTLRSLLPTLVVTCACALGADAATAQWLDHPTPGIPRGADGKPDLAAPAPRLPGGTPDLSGLWQFGGLGHATNITTVEMQPWAKAVYARRLEAFGHDDPAVGCLPEGPRSGIAGLEPLRLVQTAHMMVVLYETGAVRQIYLDGRPFPKDPTPSWMGYSVGHWDGDTLVVETMGYNDKTWLDFSGHPHSEALRVTERFRRTDFGHMQVSMTFDDPKAYTRPWTITMAAGFLPDTDLLENICLENEKDRERLIGRVHDTPAVSVARPVLARYTGSYDLGPLGSWRIGLDGDVLTVEMSDGGGRQPLVAQSETVFGFPPFGGVLRFVTDASGVATSFIVTVVEGDFPAMKQP